MKKFALGLSPISYYENDLNAFKEFCHRNGSRIEQWYCSPPWTWWTKRIKLKGYLKERRYFKKQLQVIKEENQKFQLCANIDMKSKLLTFLYCLTFIWYKIVFERYKKVDSLVCRAEYIPFLRRLFPKASITYSIQNDFAKTRLKNIEYCDTIVIGRRYIKNIPFMKEMKEKYNLRIELLLNCSCNFICSYDCFDGSCQTSQEKVIKNKGIDWCVAWQSLIPSELKVYPEGLVDFYKISSRPSKLRWMESEMDLYSSEKSLSELPFRYDRAGFWQLVCCTSSISDAVKNNIPDVNNVLKIKSRLWSEILKKDIRIY